MTESSFLEKEQKKQDYELFLKNSIGVISGKITQSRLKKRKQKSQLKKLMRNRTERNGSSGNNKRSNSFRFQLLLIIIINQTLFMSTINC